VIEERREKYMRDVSLDKAQDTYL